MQIDSVVCFEKCLHGSSQPATSYWCVDQMCSFAALAHTLVSLKYYAQKESSWHQARSLYFAEHGCWFTWHSFCMLLAPKWSTFLLYLVFCLCMVFLVNVILIFILKQRVGKGIFGRLLGNELQLYWFSLSLGYSLFPFHTMAFNLPSAGLWLLI